nr:hypothetical protein [Tanacetum cinerariifolium]
EVDSDGQEVEKDVDYSKVKVKSEFSPHKKHEKKDVKEIEIARADLIQQEIELGLWSWDDLNSEGDVVEGVLGIGGDGSNSRKTVDRLSKSDEMLNLYRLNKHIDQTTALLTENENLKVQINAKLKCITIDSVTPKVLTPGIYDIDVELFPFALGTIEKFI